MKWQFPLVSFWASFLSSFFIKSERNTGDRNFRLNVPKTSERDGGIFGK